MTPLDGHLAALAAAGGTITYGALARTLGWRMAALTTALETMMEADCAAGHPLRAAVCVGRLTPDIPAEGFFIKALSLGFDVTDRSGFVMAQRVALKTARTPDKAGS